MGNITLTTEQIARRDHLIALREKLANPMHTSPVSELSPTNATELALLNQIYDAMQSRARNDEKHAELMKTGKCAADALREMVAALECDYDRLEELREEKADYDAETHVQLLWDERPECEELAELETAAGECGDVESAQLRIQEDALEVTVRSDWYPAGDESSGATEFCILLTTGGPAVRIMGELDNGSPSRAWLEVQDWGTPWTHYREDGLSDVLLAYAGCFYFGEG